MTLLEKIRAARSLGDHLEFLNEKAGFNHCDVKPDNFMLIPSNNIQDDNKGSMSAYSIFGDQSVKFSTRVIDFGGLTKTNTSCSVYTIGYVPLDDLMHNGSILKSGKDSNKNDIFSLGTIMNRFIDLGTRNQIMNLNVVFFQLLSSLNDMQNDIYRGQINASEQNFRQVLREHGVDFLRHLAVEALAENMVKITGTMMPLFRESWVRLANTEEENESDEDIIIQLLYNPVNMMEVLDDIYTSQFTIMQNIRAVKSQWDVIAIMNSFGLSPSKFTDFKKIIQEYQKCEFDYISVIRETMYFDREKRPEWKAFDKNLSQLEQRVVEIYDQIEQAAKTAQGNSFKGPNYKSYLQYLTFIEEKNNKSNSKNILRILIGENKSGLIAEESNLINSKPIIQQTNQNKMMEDLIKNAIKDFDKNSPQGLKIADLDGKKVYRGDNIIEEIFIEKVQNKSQEKVELIVI